MSEEPLVRLENVVRRYGRIRAVDDVSFDLNPGDVLGFLGPNGAGKSTTMQIITGNLAPTAGGVQVNGVDMVADPVRAKGIVGYLPEYPPLHRELTVDEYLRYCARLNRIPRQDLRGSVETAKERCGIEGMGGRLIGNLSRGFQQRVGLAQAIVHRPEVVILDEPTIGLDPIQVREIRGLIRELGEEHGVILSTHILPEVQAVCNRVQIIHEGRLVFRESLEDLGQRMTATSLRLELGHPPDPASLEAIEGIDSVESLRPGEFRVHHGAEATPIENLARQALDNGWGLRALVPEEPSLEQVFIDLTLKDTSEAVEEAA